MREYLKGIFFIRLNLGRFIYYVFLFTFFWCFDLYREYAKNYSVSHNWIKNYSYAIKIMTQLKNSQSQKTKIQRSNYPEKFIASFIFKYSQHFSSIRKLICLEYHFDIFFSSLSLKFHFYLQARSSFLKHSRFYIKKYLSFICSISLYKKEIAWKFWNEHLLKKSKAKISHRFYLFNKFVLWNFLIQF